MQQRATSPRPLATMTKPSPRKGRRQSWKARTATLIRLYEKKYGTDNAGQLKKKISASDKQTALQQHPDLAGQGSEDIQIDLVQATICK